MVNIPTPIKEIAKSSAAERRNKLIRQAITRPINLTHIILWNRPDETFKLTAHILVGLISYLIKLKNSTLK